MPVLATSNRFEPCRGYHYPRNRRLSLSKVFVIDMNKHPLDPVHPGWARKLLSSGQAAVFRRYPFTIILKQAFVHAGRMPAKANGAFTIATATGTVTDIGHRYCRRVQRADGYGYLLEGGCGFLPIP